MEHAQPSRFPRSLNSLSPFPSLKTFSFAAFSNTTIVHMIASPPKMNVASIVSRIVTSLKDKAAMKEKWNLLSATE
ncbi:hypothetical protein ACSQ67_002659 [Phaseolus vulgaris]